MEQTFLHTGKLGDIVYGLPTIRALGGGHLFLRPEPRIGFNASSALTIIPLLKGQEYIRSCSLWCGQPITANLDDFRKQPVADTNIADCHLTAYGLSLAERDTPWLTVQPGAAPYPVLFARSGGRRGHPRFWMQAYADLGHLAGFVGSRQEHERFCREVGAIPFVPTRDLAELASVLDAAVLLVANQSCHYAIREALKKPAIVEADPEAKNCSYGRSDVLMVWSSDDVFRMRAHAELVLGASCDAPRSTKLASYPTFVDTATAGKLGKASTPGTSVVIVTFNSRSTIEACIASVLADLRPGDELIVIDNASQDRTPSFLEACLASVPNAMVVLNSRNYGFSRACNQGMLLSKGDTILLLNPDTVLPEGGMARMRARFSDPHVAAVGPVSDAAADKQWVGHYVPAERPDLEQEVRQRFAGQSTDTKLLIGFCLLLRRQVLDEVGMLDEDLFLGSDDLELSLRLRSNGYRLKIANDVFVHHIAGVSFNSLAKGVKGRLVRESTDCLLQKVRLAYGSMPSARELWGVDMLHS